MARIKRAPDKRLSAALVEQAMREAARRPASPRGDALCDVLRQLSQVVPELHDSFGRTSRVPRVDR